MQEETKAHLFWECFYFQEYWSKIQKFLKDNNLEVDLTYHRISFGILDKNNIKMSMINIKIVSEYDQEIPQSQTADNPVAPRGRAAQPSRDTR